MYGDAKAALLETRCALARRALPRRIIAPHFAPQTPDLSGGLFQGVGRIIRGIFEVLSMLNGLWLSFFVVAAVSALAQWLRVGGNARDLCGDCGKHLCHGQAVG